MENCSLLDRPLVVPWVMDGLVQKKLGDGVGHCWKHHQPLGLLRGEIGHHSDRLLHGEAGCLFCFHSHGFSFPSVLLSSEP